jgi:hypothetical protein
MDLVESHNLPDGDTLDFKRDPFSQDGVLRTIVAFAISAGGGALLLDQSDESHLQRRYLQLEGFQAVGDNQPVRLSAVMI